MSTSWIRFFLPPKYYDYEQEQKAKLLHYMLAVVFLGGLVTGISNYLNGWSTESVILFLLTAVCLVGFSLNITRHFIVAAWILCISLFVVISLLLYNGIGLYDTTILAYPIFILIATFLFGRNGLLLSTVFSIGAVTTIYLLEIYGIFESRYIASLLRAIMISFLFAVMALIVWVVRDTWEVNLTHVRDSYDMTLHGWARALEYRDGETAGHTLRVTELSVTVARKLGLGKDEIHNIQRGAYLHDIGKMAIPDRILLKPGSLTNEEWKVMKQHPVLSREFIAEIPYLQGAIPIAYSHHERWDGSGYPEGLKGRDIPLTARIFTVIDNWDALTSDRPYRKAWPREKAISYLQENSGKIFDPGVVDVFLSVVSTSGNR